MSHQIESTVIRVIELKLEGREKSDNVIHKLMDRSEGFPFWLCYGEWYGRCQSNVIAMGCDYQLMWTNEWIMLSLKLNLKISGCHLSDGSSEDSAIRSSVILFSKFILK